MEVVLSPGRFGDEPSGVPFQNEEIREWSHVDRLTGMLERARVETGRWKTLNQGAARSYGKVIDSRERNSADGSVVQRARRQVEVFQSQGAGRSIQVVRASQWSSSRITDSSSSSSSTGPLALGKSTTQKEDGLREGFSRFDNTIAPSAGSLHRDESISERLSTLLGSFAYPAASSTVPLRRIDSKYASRTPISLTNIKRSSSIEDLPRYGETHSDPLSRIKSSGESNTRGSSIILENKINNRGVVNHEEEPMNNSLSHESRDDSRIEDTRLIDRGGEEAVSTKDFVGKLRNDDKSKTISTTDNCPSSTSFIDDLRATSSKSAIHLLPLSKANTTVVNLINNSPVSQSDTETRDVKRGSLVSWVLPSSGVTQELNAARATIPVVGLNPTEESTISNPSGRAVKRVGFSKTEIHFVADSGKVNIVETDEKPPPTNRFRRRRRNSASNIPGNKNSPLGNAPESPWAYETRNRPIGQTDDSIESRVVLEDKTRTDPNLHRGHTTTVNLGSDLSTRTERSERGNEKRSDISGERTDKENHCIPRIERPPDEDYNVVCTDAENNQVLLNVVTTHEPTIARVETDSLRKKVKTASNLRNSSTKSERRSNKASTSSAGTKTDYKREHTYVNVFTGSKRTPIYENYKPSEIIATDKKVCASATTETKSEKIVSNLNPKVSLQGVDNVNTEKMKTSSDGKTSNCTESRNHAQDSLIGGKKVVGKSKEIKISSSKSSSRHEGSSSGSINPAGTSRSRSGKSSKTPTTKRSSNRTLESTNDRNLRHSSVISSGNKNNASRSSSQVVAVKTIKKSEGQSKQKPMEVVYQTAVYNMKNEKLSKPPKGKESRGPRYLNELICGAKTKRPSDSKNGKSSSTSQNTANSKGALQTIRHWK